MRDKFGRFIKGYKPIWSEESRKKVSGSMKGVNTWSKGRKFSKERVEIMRKNPTRYWLGKKRPGMTGRLHPNWKENKRSLLKFAIRDSFKYKSWRTQIFIRDNHKCVLCGHGQHLEADHYPKRMSDFLTENKILTFADAMNCQELWDLNIARTLCNGCHRKTPTYGRFNRIVMI
jgi:hypothetical protein